MMLKEHALAVVRELERNGYEAYFVGGCVRDWLLGRPVHDIDICTNALPSDLMRIFPSHVPTGMKHGTISVKQGPFLFEVTTYRTEGKYADFRRPQEVTFVASLTEDLARRDFTINAMAMDQSDRLVDPYQGQKDLQARLIRAVGEPEQRFQEDALRLLRAARFAAKLGFAIDRPTREAMNKTAHLLSYIAVERIREELHKLIDSDNPHAGCETIVETNLLREFPLLQQLFLHTVKECWRVTRLGSSKQKWSFLLYMGGFSPEQAKAVASSLKMSRHETDTIVRFVEILTKLSPVPNQPTDVDWAKLLLTYGFSVCMEVDLLLQAFWPKDSKVQSSQSLIDTYEIMPVKTLQELAVTGEDLQKFFKRKPGAWISQTLAFLLEQTALHGLSNTKEDLLAAAKKEVDSSDEH